MRVKLKTHDIIFKLFKCIFAFYSAYFAICSVIYALYSLEGFDGRIPFNFTVWIDFTSCCNYSKEEMVNTLSMLVAFPVTGSIFGLLIDHWVWDYSITVALVHMLFSCLVMLSFPQNWTWWICLAIGTLLMSASGEGVALVRRKRNQSRLVVPENDTDSPSYLAR